MSSRRHCVIGIPSKSKPLKKVCVDSQDLLGVILYFHLQVCLPEIQFTKYHFPRVRSEDLFHGRQRVLVHLYCWINLVVANSRTVPSALGIATTGVAHLLQLVGVMIPSLSSLSISASPIVHARLEFFDSPNAEGHCSFTWDSTLIASCEVLPRIDQDSNHTTKERKSHAYTNLAYINTPHTFFIKSN